MIGESDPSITNGLAYTLNRLWLDLSSEIKNGDFSLLGDPKRSTERELLLAVTEAYSLRRQIETGRRYNFEKQRFEIWHKDYGWIVPVSAEEVPTATTPGTEAVGEEQ
jgi:hypothetical protein